MSVESVVVVLATILGLAGVGVYAFYKLRNDARNAVADSADRTIKIISQERDELQRQLQLRDATIKAMKDTHVAEISALKSQVETLTSMVTKAADVERLATLMTDQHKAILHTLEDIREAVNK